MMPTAAVAARMHAAMAARSLGSGDLTYHNGPIMAPKIKIYTIFWKPAKLQNGSATGMVAGYAGTLNALMKAYPGHGHENVNTQYYDTTTGSPRYVSGLGSFGGTYTDTSAYPASGCTDSVTPGGCLSDTQIRNEIKKVMNKKGWKPGMDRIYLLFTSDGEGSCFDPSHCSYDFYCAYHSYFPLNGSTVIYGNQPYGNPTYCDGLNGPNDDHIDAAATAAVHETSEARTDPKLNAWFDSAGYENSDKCAYIYGPKTWNGGTANAFWNGKFFNIQQEYSNHAHDCMTEGP